MVSDTPRLETICLIFTISLLALLPSLTLSLSFEQGQTC